MDGKRRWGQIRVHLPEGIRDEIDRLVKEGYYRDRHDFFHEAMREHLRRIPWNKKEAGA